MLFYIKQQGVKKFFLPYVCKIKDSTVLSNNLKFLLYNEKIDFNCSICYKNNNSDMCFDNGLYKDTGAV